MLESTAMKEMLQSTPVATYTEAVRHGKLEFDLVSVETADKQKVPVMWKIRNPLTAAAGVMNNVVLGLGMDVTIVKAPHHTILQDGEIRKQQVTGTIIRMDRNGFDFDDYASNIYHTEGHRFPDKLAFETTYVSVDANPQWSDISVSRRTFPANHPLSGVHVLQLEDKSPRSKNTPIIWGVEYKDGEKNKVLRIGDTFTHHYHNSGSNIYFSIDSAGALNQQPFTDRPNLLKSVSSNHNWQVKAIIIEDGNLRIDLHHQ